MVVAISIFNHGNVPCHANRREEILKPIAHSLPAMKVIDTLKEIPRFARNDRSFYFS